MDVADRHLRPDRRALFVAEDNVIAGNVLLYGATAGQLFVRGVVGERFCVRNSGATAVVEGVGDHACEYMTGGVAVILGPTGRNLAAGMSGGVAYVLDLEPSKVNREMVDLERPDDADAERLVELVRRHAEETGSVVAEALLVDWPSARSRFTTVMPKDFKRVLQATLRAEQEGRDALEMIMEASRG